MQALKNRLDRVYKTIIGYEKSIDADSQIFPGDKNPEKMHCLSTVPEYYQLDLFTLQIAQQLPPTTADSLTKSDIGTLEQWGELLLGRSREFDESIEEYRKAILDALYPIAEGGTRNHIVDWSKDVDNVRMVYPYVGNRPIDEINCDDIEGRINGGAVYVRSIDNNGIPSQSLLTEVTDALVLNGTISIFKLKTVPIIHRPYNFEYTVRSAIEGAGSSIGEAEAACVDITYEILDTLEPYVLYYHKIRRDFVVSGQFFQEINKRLRLPPYEHLLIDLKITRGAVEISVDMLPGGEIPIIGSVNFV